MTLDRNRAMMWLVAAVRAIPICPVGFAAQEVGYLLDEAL